MLKKIVPSKINQPEIVHIAFEVNGVSSTLSEIVKAGRRSFRELVTVKYAENLEAVFVYARDLEGNIIELQSLRTT